MNAVPPAGGKRTNSRKITISGASRYLNKPQVTLAAIAVAIALGLSRLPIVESLRPIGEIYLALLQMSVLPFLLAAIPLAIRSAIAQGAARRILIGFAIWLLVFTVLIAAIGILVSVLVFGLYPIGANTTSAVGGLVGDASGQVDIEYVMDLASATSAVVQLARTNGFAELVPANIFAALSGNQITGVLVFTGIFGLSMAVTERRTGNSFFSELKHLHDVCLLIFEWLNLLVPIAIVALIAPQIAQLGSDVLLVLGQFLLLFTACGLLLIGVSIVLIARAVKAPLRHTFSEMMKPLALVAATRNSIACIPLGIEVMTKDLHASRAGCELFIPLGFTIFRFGYILHFAATTIFVGALLGRDFSASEMFLIGVLSTVASFATIGLNSPAGLAALAAVLRPFALSFELALPILIIVDPIIGMLRASVTVAVTCAIAALSGGRQQGEDILLAPTAELAPSK
jgi:Na+/H+-dicarboxylate symporter